MNILLAILGPIAVVFVGVYLVLRVLSQKGVVRPTPKGGTASVKRFKLGAAGNLVAGIGILFLVIGIGTSDPVKTFVDWWDAVIITMIIAYVVASGRHRLTRDYAAYTDAYPKYALAGILTVVLIINIYNQLNS